MKEVQVLEIRMHQQKVGRMVLTSDYRCAFEYDVEYLKTGSSISPFHLPLKKEVFIAKRTPFKGGFGVFDDSLPDGWGNLILDRYLKHKGIDPNTLTILQRLALIGSSGRGALEYSPDFSEANKNELLDFDELPQEIKQLRKKHKPGCIPPYVSLNKSGSVEDVLAAEKEYLIAKEQHPFTTDMRYFFKAIYNIIFKGKRSA